MVTKNLFFKTKLPLKHSIKPKNSKGALSVPENQIVMYAEPGIVYQINAKANKKCYLFSKPPKVKKSALKFIQEEIEIVADSKKWMVTFEDKYDKSAPTEQIMAETCFSDCQYVIARPFEYQDPKNPSRLIKHPFLMQVATYDQIGVANSQLPESGKDIRVKQIGYMYKQDLFNRIEMFKPFAGDIFPYLPSRADIYQGQMGDCFFLSAINAILAKDEVENDQLDGVNFIMSMMKQNNDGTTTVRLYHPQTLEPIYIKVENSFLYNQGTLEVNHVAPWVHILEKAYAGLGYTQPLDTHKYHAVSQAETGQKFALTNQSLLAVYGGGGKSEVALTILTGKRAKSCAIGISEKMLFMNPFNNDSLLMLATQGLNTVTNKIEAHYPNLLDPNTDNLVKQHIFEAHNNEIKTLAISAIKETNLFHPSFPSLQNIMQVSIYHALAKDPQLITTDPNLALENCELLIEFKAYLMLLKLTNLVAYDQFKQACANNTSLNAGVEYVPHNKQELMEIISKIEAIVPPPSVRVLQKLREYVDKKTILHGKEIHEFPGELGKGEYTDKAYELFEQLQDIKNKGCLITADANKCFIEGKVDGLRPEHAYAVTRVYKKKIDNKELLFVRLRNPWGTVGRVYDFSKINTAEPIAKESSDHAEFDLDINEFIRYFSGYSIGELPDESSIQEKISHDTESKLLVDKSFKLFCSADRLDFVNQLLGYDLNSCKRKFAQQGLRDLYELAAYLQNSIKTLHKENALNVDSLAKTINATFESNQVKLLNVVLREFNTRITKSQEFQSIRLNAKKYIVSHDEQAHSNLALKIFKQAKQSLKSMILKHHDPMHYFKIYQFHLNYLGQQRDMLNLLKESATESHVEQAASLQNI